MRQFGDIASHYIRIKNGEIRKVSEFCLNFNEQLNMNESNSNLSGSLALQPLQQQQQQQLVVGNSSAQKNPTSTVAAATLVIINKNDTPAKNNNSSSNSNNNNDYQKSVAIA